MIDTVFCGGILVSVGATVNSILASFSPPEKSSMFHFQQWANVHFASIYDLHNANQSLGLFIKYLKVK